MDFAAELYTRELARATAERAKTEVIHRYLRPLGDRVPEVAVILGTGWGEALQTSGLVTTPMQALPGFEALGALEGHARRIGIVEIDDVLVYVQQGRVHQNEAFPGQESLVNAMVRLQIELPYVLGARTFVLTAAVRGLGEAIEVGEIALIERLLTLHAPPGPTFGGEFCFAEDVLHERLAEQALIAMSDVPGLLVRPNTCHAMVRGPDFEGQRVDNGVLFSQGATVVGMSILPELRVIAALSHASDPARALALGFVTNGPIEERFRRTNLQRAHDRAPNMSRALMAALRQIIKHAL